MHTDRINSARRAIRRAQDAWGGCDWTHEYRRDGEIVYEDDSPLYCSGDYADCTYCEEAASDAAAASDEGDQALDALDDDDYEAVIAHLDAASRIEMGWGADPAWGPALETARELLDGLVRCQCGEVTGDCCAWVGPIDQTVLVEYMPEALRASHSAAGNSGSYPYNGAIRIRCEMSCADRIVYGDVYADDYAGDYADDYCDAPENEWARILDDEEVSRG
jgi:hypothetical protein